MIRRGGFRRTTVAASIIVAVVALLVLVGVSPLVLVGVGGPDSFWSRLGDIGQTYGAASAIISVIALVGVSGSLLLQAREVKASRDEAFRSLHVDLLKMAMENPDYAQCWGPFFSSSDVTAQRQHMYTNLIVSQWQVMFEHEALSEVRLRAVASILLQGDIGSEFWKNARELRHQGAASLRERIFNEIMDDQYIVAQRQREVEQRSDEEA